MKQGKRCLDFASLRSTVGIINRSLNKLEMPPSVSVFGFKISPSGSWRIAKHALHLEKPRL